MRYTFRFTSFLYLGALMKATSVLLCSFLLFSSVLFSEDNPNPAQQARPEQQQKPATAQPGQVSPPPKATPQPAATAAAAKDIPLKELPYTPSLDVPSMDKTADACVDFYQYSCGGWMKNNPIPGDQAAWSVYGKLTNENQQFLWGILDDLSKGGANRTPVQQKIGDYFGACMNETAVEKLGPQPLKPLLGQIAALKDNKELATFLAAEHPRTYGAGWMFGFGSDQDFADANQVIAF